MANYIITIGSNTPDKNERVAKAIEWIKECMTVISATPVYSSPDAYHTSRPQYANAIVVIQAADGAEEMLDQLFKAYEFGEGRLRGTQDVPIDIDVVVRDSDILRPRDYTAPYFLLGLPQLGVK